MDAIAKRGWLQGGVCSGVLPTSRQHASASDLREVPRAIRPPVLRGKGAPEQASALHFGGRRVRRLPCGARSSGPSTNSLRSLRSASFKQVSTSQSTKRAARAGQKPSAPQRRRGALPPARAHLCWNCVGLWDETRREPSLRSRAMSATGLSNPRHKAEITSTHTPSTAATTARSEGTASSPAAAPPASTRTANPRAACP